jgi:hypothetical protein
VLTTTSGLGMANIVYEPGLGLKTTSTRSAFRLGVFRRNGRSEFYIEQTQCGEHRERRTLPIERDRGGCGVEVYVSLRRLSTIWP